MNAESTSPTPEPPKPKGDRWIKLGFAVVALLIVGWLIGHQYIGSPLSGWDTDLTAGLAKAAAENRQLVVIVYDSPQDLNYKKLRTVVQKADNVKAMEEANVVRVHTRLADRDPLRAKYDIRSHPTTLLIGPDGERIVKWTGYIPEVDYRSKFLKGESK